MAPGAARRGAARCGALRTAAGKVLAYVLTSIPWLGTRVPVTAFYLVSGLGCCLIAFAPPAAGMALAMAAKMNLTAAFAALYHYSHDFFPTPQRNVGLGLCSQAARVGGLVAPQVIVLVPGLRAMHAYGGTALVAAFFMGCVLPGHTATHDS
mmetsp:Transcript_4874/g.17681  ORF Transcript_4874/g.17681 Transcript_4874/m.17681 type:complete len:152 (+) Transcript_4874:991-1446(+)